MKLDIKVYRKWFKDSYTIGRIFVNGEMFCNSMEPARRPLPDECPYTVKESDCKCPEKVYGKTCILPGKYKGVFNYSGMLKRKLILILDTRHFRGIRFHSVSKPSHTQGCVGLGLNKVVGGMVDGKKYENMLNELAAKATDIDIEIMDEI
jgi:hypothetical protein